MKFTNDRLQQFARISKLQIEADKRDSIMEVRPTLSSVIELSDPIRAFFLQGAAPGPGTLADPITESFAQTDLLDRTGVGGADNRDLAFFTPGLWNLNIWKTFSFTGTTNFAKFQRLRLSTLSADLGSIVASTDLMLTPYITGTVRDFVREITLPMLAPWKLTALADVTVALDELHTALSLIARRFI